MSQTKKHCEPLVAVWLRPSTTEPCICCKQVAEKPRGEHLKNDVCMYVCCISIYGIYFAFKQSINLIIFVKLNSGKLLQLLFALRDRDNNFFVILLYDYQYTNTYVHTHTHTLYQM